MALITEREYFEQFEELLNRVRRDVTPFRNDTPAKRRARVARAKVDKLFFAATYFPHYIELKPEYKEVWKTPEAEIDWFDAGFAKFHEEYFRLADVLKVFTLFAGFRGCAKSTLLGKIDPIWKVVFEERWYIPIIAKTEKKAESKIIPLKIEFEENVRLKNDFGDLVGKRQWENGFIVTSTGRAFKGLSRDQSLRGEEVNGHRYDHFVIDDISDPDLPDSPAVVEQKVDWVKKSVMKGVNAPRWSGIMLCNWTVEDDITDRLMRGRHTEHFKKVITRVLEPNPLETKQDREIARACREAGFPTNEKSTWQFRHPTIQELEDRKNDPETHDCEMMMRPRKRKGKIFHDHWFRFHRLKDLDLSQYDVFTFVDPSGTETGDNKAVVTVGVGVIEEKLHIPVLKADIQQQGVDWMLERSWDHFVVFKSIRVGVADNMYEDFVKREYRRFMAKKKRPLPFFPIKQVGNKRGRIARLAPLVKDAIVTFDPDDPDQDLLMRQLKAEPNPAPVNVGGVGDDGSDALEGAVTLVTDYPGTGEVNYRSVTKREMSFEEGTY